MAVDGSSDQRDATKHVGKRTRERDCAGDSGRVREGFREVEVESVKRIAFACRLGSDTIVWWNGVWKTQVESWEECFWMVNVKRVERCKSMLNGQKITS